MASIGHNRGPETTGTAWRAHCWRQARERLLPVLPVEVVRLRVRRAAELGLDYKTYAGVRSTTGRDIIAFLFSSNALRVDAAAQIPPDVAARLAALDRLPGDGVVLVVSDAPWEAEWLAAGKLAGLIPAQRFFAAIA